MKQGATLVLSLALLFSGGALVAAPDSAIAPPVSAATQPAAAEWADAKTLEKRLANAIRRLLPGQDTAALESFLAKPGHRQLLTQWHLAHRAAQAPPPSAEDAAALSTPQAAELFNKLADKPGWWEQLAYSGECANPARTMGILAAMAAEFPGLADAPMPLSIATATALEWAKTNWDTASALARARFYIESDRENRFHRGFRKLPFWQLRIICGCKADNAHGNPESLRWALDNVHLPADQYPGCCWQANYLEFNLFHDSIHGAYYYAPYSGVYGNNGMQRTKEVGGVCGSLSHFGAFAALGNGVPALTAGEPGHCAYIVLVNGKWVPAYSLSWQRGLHWQVWRGVYVYSSLHMATELYSEAQQEKTALSHARCALGQLTGDLGLLRRALKAQPLNFPAWRAYASFLKTRHPKLDKVWQCFNLDVCQLLAPRYPEMAAELLKTEAYPHFTALTNKQLPPAFAAFWKAVGIMGPDRWDIEALSNAQLGLLEGRLRDAGKPQKELACASLYRLILTATANKPAYAHAVLAWGNGKAAGMDNNQQKRFLAATLHALGKGRKGSVDTAARDRMLAQAMLGAERMRDRSAFQSIGKLLSPNYRQPKDKLPAWEPFPGKLVSQGGLLCTSSTCQHDDPAAHWGVLEPTGGRFHTGGDKDAWALVQLPKTAILSGVVVIAPGSNLWRLTGMKVQYSESGRDDDWQDAGPLPNPTGQRVNRLDLSESRPRARYIRILRPGGPELFHLNAIFVYGKPAA